MNPVSRNFSECKQISSFCSQKKRKREEYKSSNLDNSLLLNVPKVILNEILSYLPAQDLITNVPHSCKILYQNTKTESIWKQQINRKLKARKLHPDSVKFETHKTYHATYIHFAKMLKNGSGKLFYLNGITEIGYFKRGLLNGIGKRIYPDGKIEKGRFRNGARWLQGFMRDSSMMTEMD